MTLAERFGIGTETSPAGTPTNPAPGQDRVGSTRWPQTFQGLGKERGAGNDWTLGGTTGSGPNSPTERLQQLQGAPTSGGGQQTMGGLDDLHADRAASRRVGGGSDSSVEVNVNSVTGDSVEQAVVRAVEREKSRIETDVQRKVEETIAQQSGVGSGAGGGL